jgi:hypothetical protein
LSPPLPLSVWLQGHRPAVRATPRAPPRARLQLRGGRQSRRRPLTWSRVSTRLQHKRHLRSRLPLEPLRRNLRQHRRSRPSRQAQRAQGRRVRHLRRRTRLECLPRLTRPPQLPHLQERRVRARCPGPVHPVHPLRQPGSLTTVSNSTQRRSQATGNCRRCYTSCPGSARTWAISLVNP